MIFPLDFDCTFADEKTVSREEQYPSKFFTYEGEWKMGKLDGHGKLVFPSGASYEGQFKSGKLDGQGKCTYACG